MTSDFDAPLGDFANTPVSAEALRASTHQYTDEILRAEPVGLVDSKPHAHPESAAYRTALDILTVAVVEMAATKNVLFDPGMETCIARQALEWLRPKLWRGLTHMDQHALVCANLAVNRALDIWAATQLGYAVFRVCGEPPRDPMEMIAIAQDALAREAANDRPSRMRVWPDLEESARLHLEPALTHDPVRVMLPGLSSVIREAIDA